MPDTSLIGTTLAGRFRITGVIGEGGMATVYRGIQDDQPKDVAVKIMNPDLAKESRFVRRFRREAKAASMLKHPNTVQIVEFGVDQNMVFMVMELLQGYDLAMLLHRERRIPEARAVQIVAQVCRALSAAHEQSIVHRDLKPDNIMLVRQPPGASLAVAGMNPNDFVKVLDFGIAKILDDEPGSPGDPRGEPITQEKSMLTRVGTIVGTPAYMAPEQGRAEAVDARTDLYACGVLIYELITGRVPFTGETPMQVVMRHVNEPPRPPSDYVAVNPELERLIMRALAKYPAERQQSAEEMAFDLLNVLPKLPQAAPSSHGPSEVNKTLVIDPLTGADRPPPRPVVRVPTPAAGRPGGPARPRMDSAPTNKGGALAAATIADGPSAHPFPTLNIEVPDDIFPPLPGDVPSTDPVPTERRDIPATRPAAGAPPPPAARPGAGQPPAPRANAPARIGAEPAVPVVRPGVAPGSPLASTLHSTPDQTSPPADSPTSTDDDEEAATFVKAPTDMDKARMSFAEEAMAKALGQPPAAVPARAGVAAPEPGAPESIETTLIAGLNVHPSPKPGESAAEGGADLRALQSTVRVDPSQAEKAVQEALAGGANKAASPSPPASPRASGADLGDDAKAPRKPTGELIPVKLPEERPSRNPDKLDNAAVWQPKGRKLGGAMALVLGILIGALLVAAALLVAIVVRRS
jgi:serine/threonine-protein kinase